MEKIILTLHLIVAIIMVAVILIQKNEGGGLGIGGGSGMSGFMTGRSAANFLTRVTAILAACFFLTSIALVIVSNQKDITSPFDQLEKSSSSSSPNNSLPAEQKDNLPTVPVGQ
ncbi:MAG: preprotein translocase subunit SecG [Alphaproteobacteria bacterium]|nr:preprotein translocase subunit SecG [Alphaproteobacteria bacterium]